MTFGKMVGLGLVCIILVSAVRIFFDRFLNLDNRVIYYVMLLFIALIAIAVSRRLGVLSYIEALMVGGVWFVMLIAFDFLVTSLALGLNMFDALDTWRGYLVFLIAIILLHKKRHVEIRRQMAQTK